MDKPPQAMQHAASATGLSNDYIVFVPTSTPEKVALYQHAADTAGWPIQFRPMQDLVDAFHIIDETEGDYEKNAKDKLKAARTIIERFHNGESDKLIDLCEKKWGIRFQPDHIVFATDDSGLDAPPGVWEKADKTGLSADTQERIDAYLAMSAKNPDKPPKGGSGTELSPTLSGVLGSGEYMRRLCNVIMEEAAFNPEITGKDIEFVEHATLAPRLLSEKASREPLSCYSTHIFQPTPQPESDILTNYHYLRPKTLLENRPEDAGKTAARLGWDYIGYYSPKRQVVDRLATEVLGLTEQDKRPRRKLADPTQPFKVSWVDFDSHAVSDVRKNSPPSIVHHFGANPGSEQPIHAALKEVETLVKNNDGFVLMPDHGLKDIDRFRKYYTLFSMIVARQLVGRDMNKPIIIQNHDGCWDDAVAMHTHLVKRSMSKDFVFSPHRRGLPEDKNTTLHTNGYFDVVSGSDLKAIGDRTAQLLDWHRERYEKRDPIEDTPKTYEGGVQAPEGMYKVAVFLSAGNENEDLNNATRAFCKKLALKGYGMVTGGGDRYAMGAAYEGYREGQEEIKKNNLGIKTWSGAFSTDILLKSETKDGAFAKITDETGKVIGEGFNYRKCCADIYERMANMLETSDTVVVRAGGAGTMEEWMAFLMLKQQFPDKMAGKNIIIYDPTVFATDKESFYEPILRPVLGKHYDAIMGKAGKAGETELQKDFKQTAASQEMGIYVADSDEKVMQLVDRLAHIKHKSDLNNWSSGDSGEVREHMQKTTKTGFTEDYEAKRSGRSPYLGLQ